MGIMDFLGKQFVDVIQWVEDEPNVLAYRYPMQGMEIQNGAQLVVRETQAALFVNEGKFADQFAAGTYTLNTKTLPVLTYLQNWDKAFESPFKSDVFFFSLREQTNLKWGTPNPITFRDNDFGIIRLRAFGTFSYAIDDLKTFFTRFSGTTEVYRVSDLDGQIRAGILTHISNFLASSKIPFLDMAANQQQFSDTIKLALVPAFKDMGLKLSSFFVENLSLPEELQAHIDKVGSMRVIGDLKNYTQFQVADSIPTAAANEGGVAGAGAGLGAGLAMAQAMTQGMQGNTGSFAATAPEDPIAMIEKLSDLLKKGAITQAEFDAKKTDLLKKI